MLNSTQRSYLRKLAHNLKPVIIIGKSGLTEGVLQSIDYSLKTHELIKIKFGECKDQKTEFIDLISSELDCEVAGRVGNTAILFRQNKDITGHKRINLPDPGKSA